MGNFVYTESNSLTLFKSLFRVVLLLLGLVSVGLILFINDFIKIWIGVDNVLGYKFAPILLGILFFTSKARVLFILFRDAIGEWYFDRWKPVIGVVLNIALSLVGYKLLGLMGVIIGSVLVYSLVYLPFEVILLQQKLFTKDYNYVKWTAISILVSLALIICIGFISVVINSMLVKIALFSLLLVFIFKKYDGITMLKHVN